ncbi:hypothetical protein M501DRAFT_981993 [Patellaria atrata CBS 101060]|uniref:Checkpoint protein RAD24-like helical bundle domain-containing protein n=1 Tax=Patellaria atrata CBS 101060 TaxID=1346257 RepID=A0A9P4S4C5_9PEZI|nr:hypothetical protein M501DRAFT_981993 [Patellaria atrata CBS 101060]
MRKRGREAEDIGGGQKEGLPSGSQKFLKRSNGSKQGQDTPIQQERDFSDQRPWTEQYGPNALHELVVHRDKVSKVRSWFENTTKGIGRQPILILKGGAGSGKTTTVRLLSQELGIELHEWRNPDGGNILDEGSSTTSTRFEDFIGRAGHYGRLDMDVSFPDCGTRGDSVQGSRKHTILIEEFPNTYSTTSSTLRSFRSTIQRYLAVNVPLLQLKRSITPIIMIITETLLSTNTPSQDSFTAFRLLGPELLHDPGLYVLEFNPVASTLLKKALELVVIKEARRSGRRQTPGPMVIDYLSRIGDLRSAISTLEFLCVRGDGDNGWGAKVAFSKPKKKHAEPLLTKMEEESLQLITRRESILTIFHAVGKIVYNKRQEIQPTSQPIPQPPTYFPNFARNKPPEVDVDSLHNEIGTDTQTFIAALHENYVLSCNGLTEEDSMESAWGCIASISDSDILSPDRFSLSKSAKRSFQGSGIDNLRQDDFSYQASARGLLFNLPSQVKRLSPPSVLTGEKSYSKANSFKIFYPTSAKLWRQQEEIEGLLDLFVTAAQKGEYDPFQGAERATAKTSEQGVEAWQGRNTFSSVLGNNTGQNDGSTTDCPPIFASGTSAKLEMLLERLPYAAILKRKTVGRAIQSTSLKKIEQITTFRGIGINTEETPDDDDSEIEPSVEQWSTDTPVDRGNAKSARRKPTSGGIKPKTNTGDIPSVGEEEIAALVLEDDDIEDF